MRKFAVLITLFSAASGALHAAESEDAAAIRKRVDSYVAAYNRQDAEAVAAHWAPTAIYVDRESGDRREGRAAIQEMFAEVFADPIRERLSARVTSIRFVASNVAVEEGVARIVSEDAPPSETSYTAVHVKQDGKWFLDSVRETVLPSAPSHHKQLEALAWMIGEWVDQDENATISTRCQWTKNHNFITRSFKVQVKDRINLEGTQVIGWDPAAGRIRSWMFDSDGGFAESTWSAEGNRWVIKSSAVLPDGRRGAHIRVVTKVDNNTMTLQTVTRSVDGEILPNIEKVTVVRASQASE